jgi:hypothetical protein
MAHEGLKSWRSKRKWSDVRRGETAQPATTKDPRMNLGNEVEATVMRKARMRIWYVDM